MSESDSTKILVALIGAGASFVVAAASAIYSYLSGMRLEWYRSKLAEAKAERDARRDYQYDARRSLYEKCEPLLFQFMEQSGEAYHRLRSLARSAKQGSLGPERESWLCGPGYYFYSTSYKLMAPLATLQVLQRHLTLVDLSLDPAIRMQYAFARALLETFTADHDLAKAAGLTSYDPPYFVSMPIGRGKFPPDPEVRQGVAVGRLENATEAMLVQEGDSRMRCMTFGEFEAACEDRQSPACESLWMAAGLFCNFHPATKPVLWRVLMAQATIYEALRQTRKLKLAGREDEITLGLLRPVPEADRQAFDWRQHPGEASDEDVLVRPFEAGYAFVAKILARDPV